MLRAVVLRVGSLSPAEELVGATDNRKKIAIVRAIGKAMCAGFIYAPPFELGTTGNCFVVILSHHVHQIRAHDHKSW